MFPGGVFKSLAYQITIASVYLIAGFLLVFSEQGQKQGYSAVGWVLVAYGLFRLATAAIHRFRK
jgi:hypothetical protein